MFARTPQRFYARTLLTVLAANLFFANSVNADITILSQTRSVSAEAVVCSFPQTDFSSVTSTLSGRFDESVSEEMTANDLRGEFIPFCTSDSDHASSSAMQDTTITGSSIRGTGVVGAGANGLDGGSAEASSTLSVMFQVATPTAYELFGVVDGFQSFGPGPKEQGNSRVALFLGEDMIHSAVPNLADEFGFGTENSFAFNGTLTPGTYTLIATAEEMYAGSEGGHNSNFSFTFVPEPSTISFPLIGAVMLIRFRHCAERRERRLSD